MSGGSCNTAGCNVDYYTGAYMRVLACAAPTQLAACYLWKGPP